MTGGNSLLVAFLIFAGCGVVILVCTTVIRRRSKGLATWAAANGWQYTARDNSYTQMPLGDPFGVGYNHSAYDIVTGTSHGYPAACFTYHYDLNRSARAGQTIEPRFCTVWSLRLPRTLPAIRVRREGILTATLHPSAMPVVEVGDVRFHVKYQVSSADPAFAAALLDAQMMQFLLDSNGGGFEIAGSDIVAIRQGQSTQDTVLSQLDYLAGVIAHFPATVNG